MLAMNGSRGHPILIHDEDAMAVEAGDPDDLQIFAQGTLPSFNSTPNAKPGTCGSTSRLPRNRSPTPIDEFWKHDSASDRPQWHSLRSLFVRATGEAHSTVGITSSSQRSASPSQARLFALSPSPMPNRSATMTAWGTASDPIDIEQDCSKLSRLKITEIAGQPNHLSLDGRLSLAPREEHSGFQGTSAICFDDVTEDSPALERNRQRDPTKREVLVDLERWEENLDDSPHSGLDRQIIEIDNTARKGRSDRPLRTSSTTILQQRNPPVVEPWRVISKSTHNGMVVQPGTTVELKSSDSAFMHIVKVIQNSITKEVMIRGQHLQRTQDLNGMLERKLNEVCLVYEIDLFDRRDAPEQNLVEVSVDDISRLRQLHWTNQNWPDDRATRVSEFQNKHAASLEGPLTIRWKLSRFYASDADRHHNTPCQHSLEHIREGEVNDPIPDSSIRTEWRGVTVPGGAYQPSVNRLLSGKRKRNDETYTGTITANSVNTSRRVRHRVSDTGEASPQQIRSTGLQSALPGLGKPSATTIISLEDDNLISLSTKNTAGASNASPARPIKLFSSEFATPPPCGTIRANGFPRHIFRTAGQQYTYGDAFCGAGGATRGAFMAGLRMKWGFDFSQPACQSWEANFPNATCYPMSAQEFVEGTAKREVDAKVDVLHLSPPCQYFSPAHTVDGPSDEMNVASLFAVGAVVNAAKPRIVTLEQTFGLMAPRFRNYFNAVVHMFTALHFSLRWAVVPLPQWGLPQRRKRLIIIASCPGEILPEMPPPTHSENPHNEDGLKAYRSVKEAISNISPDAPGHNPDAVDWPTHKLMRRYSGDNILPRAMTTSGGQNYHPSGERDFTLREYACLQGFPENHIFKGSSVKKQIGNAVPPSIAQVLFQSVKEALEKADGIENAPEMILVDEGRS